MVLVLTNGGGVNMKSKRTGDRHLNKGDRHAPGYMAAYMRRRRAKTTPLESPAEPAATGLVMPPFLLEAMAEQDRRTETYKKLMANSPKHKKPKR
jgi:hypothetical protein